MSAFEIPRPRVDVERLLSERQWVQRLARSLVADPNQADDVAQESWLTALRHPPRHDANLKSWLSRLVRNTAATLRRRDARRTERELIAQPPTATVGSSEALERAEVVRELVEAVLALEPARREALVLVYFEGLAPNVAADQLGLPHSTFRTHVRRGLAEVREKLERKRGRESWLPALTVLACRPDVPVVGVMFMSTKLVTAAAAAILIALGVWTWSKSRSEEEMVNATTTSNTQLSVVEAIDQPISKPDGRAARALVATQPSARSTTLIVSAKWAASGQPASQVQVRLDWKDGLGIYRNRQLRADAEGRAVFENLDTAYVGVSTDRGFEDGTALVPHETTAFEARIPTDVRIRGRVVGAGDEPVFGAAIFAGPVRGRNGFDEPLCTTDGDGRFDLGLMSRQRQIYARRGDLGSSTAYWPLEAAQGTIDILLRMQGSGAELNGTVVGEDGAPIANAEIFDTTRINVPATTTADGYTGRAPEESATTDQNGRFRIRGLVACKHGIRVRADGFGTHEEEVQLASGAALTLRVVLARSTGIHGVVRDANGAVVPNATVMLLEPQVQVRADEQGAFRIVDVKAGTRRFQVRTKKSGLAWGSIDVPNTPTFEWNPVVDPGDVIEGRLVDEEGRALANWWMRSHVITDSFDSEEEFELLQLTDGAVLRTDADGRFLFTNCSKYPPRLTVYADEGDRSGALRLTVENVEPGTKDLVLRVPKARVESKTVSGRVIDEQGTPIEGAHILLVPNEKKSPKTWVNADSAPTTGAFSLAGVEAGEYKVVVRASGRCEHVTWLTVADDSIALDPIRLVRGGSLVVQLSPEDAERVRAGKVELSVKTSITRQLVVFGEEARLDDIEPGEWTLDSARSSGRPRPGASVKFQIKAGETTRIEFDLGELRKR